jgi:YVTN family beta-propeller protein
MRTARPLARLIPLAPAALLLLLGAGLLRARSDDDRRPAPATDEPHRSPYALALSADGTRLVTANQTADSVSLVDPIAGRVLDEIRTGPKPFGVAISRDGTRAVVTHWYGDDVAILGVEGAKLRETGRVAVGPEPRGVAMAGDGKTAYVAVGVANEVVRVDLEENQVTGRLAVGREPWGLAITPDGRRLIVGNNRARSLGVIDLGGWTVGRTIPIEGENLRQIAFGPDGRPHVASMTNRGFATTSNNIDLGWVVGQRVTRVDLEGPDEYATLSLDPHGKAVGDVHGLAFRPDGTTMAVAAGGTHEVLLLRLDGKRLPWRFNGSRDLMAPDLVADAGRFRRVETGGRPLELAFSPDGKRLYVANYLLDAVQVIDPDTANVVGTIALGGPKEGSLARKGEALFHDATRSFNQWYSCNTCHSDGHTNGGDYDTMNDGWQDFSTAHLRSRKKAPTLRRVLATGPWTWHGWQTELDDAMFESFTKSMQGAKPGGDDVKAIVAFLGTLDYPPNPFRRADGTLSEAARRGELVYNSSKAACRSCHGGPELTDGKVHDVGLNERGDVYKGHNPPSLRGVYDKDPYLHDGRAATLKEALTKGHSPQEVTGLGELSEAELDDLIAYLKSL